MSLFSWCTRRVGGLSVMALTVLCCWVISKEFILTTIRDTAQIDSGDRHIVANNHVRESGKAGNFTILFAYYSVFVHALLFLFPIRSCWAIAELSRDVASVIKSKQSRKSKSSLPRRSSSSSLSSSETLVFRSSSSSEFGDNEPNHHIDTDSEQDTVIHVILIPNYKENVEDLRETLDVLASHSQACHAYDVYLAMEARELNAELKALGLVSEFVKDFRFIGYTLHPGDIPGESPGKGSNLGWAARRASERYLRRKNVIVTGIDADSHLSSNYFGLITNMHSNYSETAATTLYSAPIIFDRNAHLVPALVRVADILWCAAGLSGLYRTSSIRPPTSVYSLPLELVDRVGGWDVDSEAIGEDLHMYIKCFFAVNGNLTSRTVLAPVSQSNVSSGKNGVRGYAGDVRARYKQALRHMWGALDSGFAMRELVNLWRQRKAVGRSFRPLHVTSETEHAYVPQFDDSSDDGLFSDVIHDTLEPPDYMRVYFLFHRLFEAHFLPTHMAILVVASSIYLSITAGKDDSLSLAWTFQLCNYLRITGSITVITYLILYERYHRICVEARRAEMKRAGLDEGMVFSTRSFWTNLSDYLVFPIIAPLYSSIPAVQAQICHFWTLDLVYTVSKKPTRQVKKLGAAVGTAKE